MCFSKDKVEKYYRNMTLPRKIHYQKLIHHLGNLNFPCGPQIHNIKFNHRSSQDSVACSTLWLCNKSIYVTKIDSLKIETYESQQFYNFCLYLHVDSVPLFSYATNGQSLYTQSV